MTYIRSAFFMIGFLALLFVFSNNVLASTCSSSTSGGDSGNTQWVYNKTWYTDHSLSPSKCSISVASDGNKDSEPIFSTNTITHDYVTHIQEKQQSCGCSYDSTYSCNDWEQVKTKKCTSYKNGPLVCIASYKGFCYKWASKQICESYSTTTSTKCTDWDDGYNCSWGDNGSTRYRSGYPKDSSESKRCSIQDEPSLNVERRYHGYKYDGTSPGNGITIHRARAHDPGGWTGSPGGVNSSDWSRDAYAYWVKAAEVWFNEGEGQEWSYEKDSFPKVNSRKLYGDDEWVIGAGHHQKYYGLYSVLDDGGDSTSDTFAKFYYYYRDPYTHVTEDASMDGHGTQTFPTSDNYTTRWWLKDVAIYGSIDYEDIDDSGYYANNWNRILFPGEHTGRYCYPYFYGDPRDGTLQSNGLEKGPPLAQNYVYRTELLGNQGPFTAETQSGRPPGETNNFFSATGNTGWAGQGRLNVPYESRRGEKEQWYWDEDSTRVLPAIATKNMESFYAENTMETTRNSRIDPSGYIDRYNSGYGSWWYVPRYSAIESLYKLDYGDPNQHWTRHRYGIYLFDLAYSDVTLDYNCSMDYSWFINSKVPYLLTGDYSGASARNFDIARDLTLQEDGGIGELRLKKDWFTYYVPDLVDVDMMIEGCFYTDDHDEMECYYKKDGTEIRVEETSPGAIPPELDGMYFIKGHWYNFDMEATYEFPTSFTQPTYVTRLNGMPEAVWHIDPWIKDETACCTKNTNSEADSLRTLMPYSGLEHQLGESGIHNLHFEWFDNVTSIDGVTNFDIQFDTIEMTSLDILNESGDKGPTIIDLDSDNTHEFKVELTFDNGVDTFQYDWTNSMNEWYYDPYTMKQNNPNNRAGLFTFLKGNDIYKEWQRGGVNGDHIERKIYAVWFDDILDYVLYKNNLNRNQKESTNTSEDTADSTSDSNVRSSEEDLYLGSGSASWKDEAPTWIHSMDQYGITDSNWDMLADFHTVKLTNNCQNIKRYVNKCDVPYSWQTQDPYSSSRQAKLNANWKSYRSLGYGENFIPFNSSDASYNKNPYFIDLRFPVTGASNGVGEY